MRLPQRCSRSAPQCGQRGAAANARSSSRTASGSPEADAKARPSAVRCSSLSRSTRCSSTSKSASRISHLAGIPLPAVCLPTTDAKRASKWRHRDDVTDDHLVVREDHPVDDQPQDPLPDLERRVDERVAKAGAKRLETPQQPDLPLPLRAVAADLVEPLPQMPAMVLDLPPTLLQLLQLDRAGLIGVDQPPDRAVQHLELALDARALALVGAVDGGIAAALLEARPQEGRIGQQPADPAPDLLLERPGRGAPAITGARGVARVAGRADVTVPATLVRGADHAPATPAADQQRAQQIPAPGVVPCGALAVAGQLLLGQAPKLGVDDGGHRHRDPLLRRPGGLAAPIARAEILEAGLAARLDPIRRAPAIVPALALVARVRQDPDHGALRPAAPAAPAA